MSRLAAALIATILFAPIGASAKTFPVPADDPIATVSIPDKWEPHDYDGGVEATSVDGAVYVAAEAVKAKDVGDAAGEAVEWFAKQGVEIDAKSLKTEDIKVNGMPGFDLTMTGTDKDGPTTVDMTLVKTNSETRLLILYFWGSAKGAKDNAADLGAIAQSIQSTK